MIFEPGAAWCLAIALLVDRFVIDPDRLWRRIPHPVVGFGWLIDRAERAMRGVFRGRTWERSGGIAILAGLVTISVAIGWLIVRVPHLGAALSTLGAAVLLAQRSLGAHVERVGEGLRHDLSSGRREVAMIVGRDVTSLDESGVSSAAIESLAENVSDGVVAPAFWYLLLGLPGIVAYKAVNTADSMIGHRTPRFERLGWASARFDDLLNLVPARLTALLIAAASGRFHALATAWRDARLHRSPNAGWPEAAMAAALGVRLGGPRRYGADLLNETPMNATGRPAAPADIARALRVFGRVLWLLLASVVLVAILGSADQIQDVLDHA